MTMALAPLSKPNHHIEAILALDPYESAEPVDTHFTSECAPHAPGPEWPPDEWD